MGQQFKSVSKQKIIMNSNFYNLISSLKNAQQSKKSYIYIKKNRLCLTVLNILWDEGFILGYKIMPNNFKKIKIFLKYKNKDPVIKTLKILTKPSLKIFFNIKELWKINLNKGIFIISTSKGIKTIEKCLYHNIGGELLFYIK